MVKSPLGDLGVFSSEGESGSVIGDSINDIMKVDSQKFPLLFKEGWPEQLIIRLLQNHTPGRGG
jgi:hypothetical protein